jgi:hypothetical protein
VFGAIVLGGTPETEFPLHTRRQSRIPNSQALPGGDPSSWARLLSRYDELGLEVRKAACGTYNCAGHVWASRRTAIHESSAYELILRDDEYRRVQPGEAPQIGDLALYRLQGEARILHVGIVAEFRRVPAQLGVAAARSVPWVLSKWADWGGEVFHHVERVPLPSALPFEIEYWTDRERT